MTSLVDNSTDIPPADFIDAAAEGTGLIPMFQPVVSLADGKTVGYEALARWPSLAQLRPEVVFERAAATGRLDRLDRVCTSAAISAALQAGLGSEHLLMVNCEAGTARRRCDDDELTRRARSDLQVVYEITERSLLRHPKTLLQKVAAIRRDGFAVALDDVGARPDSLALLDVLAPDVIKLDIDMVQSRLSEGRARKFAGVLAHQERTGALILAEGIETDGHLERALALGATLGQGFRFGAAAPLPQRPPASWTLPAVPRLDEAITGSLFDAFRHHLAVRTVPESVIIELSHHIETLAHPTYDPPILLTALHHRNYFSEPRRHCYRKLADRSVLVAVFGEKPPRSLGPAVRTVRLDSADPLCNEWIVVALGPHISAAVIAREHARPARTTGEGRFDIVLTYDRELVISAARALMYRIP